MTDNTCVIRMQFSYKNENIIILSRWMRARDEIKRQGMRESWIAKSAIVFE